MSKKHIELTMEEVGRAIFEYVQRTRKETVLKIDYNVQTDMTDNAEPHPYGKLVGVLVETI